MDLTVKEIAGLKGCSERYIRKAINDKKITAYIKPNSKIYLIPLSTLDPRLQQKYYKANGIQMQLPEVTEEKEKVKPKHFDEFSEDEREKISFWIDILQKWQDFRVKYKGKKIIADDVFVSNIKSQYPALNISTDILYRKKKALDSKDFAGLLDNRGKWNKGQTKLPKDIFDIFVYHYLDERKPTISECIERVRMTLEETDLELLAKMPSYHTFRREVMKISKPILTLGREGEKAYNDRCAPYIIRIMEHLQSNDYWIADNHTLDIFSSDGIGGVHRLSLCMFIDARSGMPVGWNIAENPSSESTILALRHAIKRCGIPKNVYFDNGSEFLTYDLAGRGHRTKKNGKNLFIPPPIFKRLGIEMRNALVRNAKAKPIERTFRDIKEQISKLFDTYCGGNIMERPENLKKILKKGEIPLDSYVREMIDTLLSGYISNNPYGGNVARDKGLTKAEVFKKYLPATLRYATDGELDLMLMRSTRVQKIGRNGVHLKVSNMRLEYGMEELASHFGKEVYLRYDPADVSTVRVYAAPEDTYMMTVPMNINTRIKFDDDPEKIKIAQQEVKGVAKKVKKELKDIKDAVPVHRRIDALDLKIRKAHKQDTNAVIFANARMIEFAVSNEKADNPAAEQITEITIDGALMNLNAERRMK